MKRLEYKNRKGLIINWSKIIALATLAIIGVAIIYGVFTVTQ